VFHTFEQENEMLDLLVHQMAFMEDCVLQQFLEDDIARVRAHCSQLAFHFIQVFYYQVGVERSDMVVDVLDFAYD